MTREFEALAREVKSEWSLEGARAFEDASAEFAQELESRRVLGTTVASLRKDLGLTQSALAAATGIQQSEISRIERGRGNPTVDTLSRLARAMGRRIGFETVDVTQQ